MTDLLWRVSCERVNSLARSSDWTTKSASPEIRPAPSAILRRTALPISLYRPLARTALSTVWIMSQAGIACDTLFPIAKWQFSEFGRPASLAEPPQRSFAHGCPILGIGLSIAIGLGGFRHRLLQPGGLPECFSAGLLHARFEVWRATRSCGWADIARWRLGSAV